MNGKETASAPSVEAAAPPRPHGAVVTYANEPEGRRIATALVRELRERGVDIISDHELAMRNPVSVPTWMDDQIGARIVICVITPG
jgi:hypothetical protein